jgi:putative ABC transport system permease protein
MINKLDSLLRDVRFTGRLLAARPGWTAAAVLCLAIATGANTAAFTVVNGLLLRPLPFEQPEQLVMVALRERSHAGPRPFALREYRALSNESGDVGMLLARTFFPLSLSAEDGAQMAQTELVSGNCFETLRVKPFAGRFFDSSADRKSGQLQAVLSHALWRRRFGADLTVVGQSMRVNGRPMVVAGIAPPGFVGAMQLIAADLWLPAAAYPDLAGSTDADTVPMFGVMGRLSPDVTAGEAQAQLTSMAAALPRTGGSERAPAVMVTPAAGFGVPVAVQGTILTLSGFIYVMMALLMAVASANVAALVLARGAGRSREIAVRLSLGASRWHIARQLLTESLALALVGCAAGTVVALWLTQVLVGRLSTPFQYVNYAIDVHPDARVFAYSAIVTALAAVLCGVAPIRYAGRVDVLDVLKQSSAKGRSRQSQRTLNAMVVMQFAVSTTLLVVAGMLVRSYVGAQSTQPGFDTTGVIATTLDVGQVGLERGAGISLYQQVMERLSALPGVNDVSLTRDLPFGSGRTVPVVITDTATLGVPVVAAAMVVSPNYFETLGVAIRHGRSFTNAEPARPRVAIVNESMARRLWPEGSPLGRVFGAKDGEPIEVIGIAPDVGERSLNQRPQPTFYQAFPHEYSARMTVLMRVQGDPGSFAGELRRTIREVNRDLSIVDLRTLDQLLDASAAQRRVPATVLSVVGLLGLLLSAVGLYGVVAYGVRERAHEIGIRLALGARPIDVRRLVLRQGFTIVAIGLTVGGVGAIVSAQVVRRLLFGISPFDPPTLATVCAILVVAAFGALYLPARWASRLEPAQTLRGE